MITTAATAPSAIGPRTRTQLIMKVQPPSRLGLCGAHSLKRHRSIPGHAIAAVGALKSSLWAMPGGKEPNIRPKTILAGPTPYVVPRGWVRVGLADPRLQDPDMDVFNKWSASFHAVASRGAKLWFHNSYLPKLGLVVLSLSHHNPHTRVHARRR